MAFKERVIRSLMGLLSVFVLTVAMGSEGIAQQLHCDPSWTAEYKCMQHCGPCPSSGGGGGGGGGFTPQQQMMLNGFQQMMPFLQQGVHDSLYGSPADQAAAQAAAARAAEEAARKQAEAKAAAEKRATQIKSELQGSLGGIDSSSSAGNDLKLLTNDQLFDDQSSGDISQQLLGGTGTKFFGSGGNGCAPSQDASVVDLCGVDAKTAVVDPNAIKIDPSTPSVGGAGVTKGAPDAVVKPNAPTTTAAFRPAPPAGAKASPPAKSSTADDSKNVVGPDLLATTVPLLRQPEMGGPIAPGKRPAICEPLSRQLDETYQVARRAVLASDVYDRYTPDKAGLPAMAAFDRVSDDSLDMAALFPGEDSKAIKSLIVPDDSDYRAAIYRDRKDPKKIFLVFRGTTSVEDFQKGNIPQGEGLGSAYYARAIALAKMLKKNAVAQGLDLELIGHSLGGGMADAAGVANQIKTTSFNPAGVHPNSLPAGTDLSAAGRYLTDYVVDGEPLNAHQDHPLTTRAEVSGLAVVAAPLTVAAMTANTASGAANDVMTGGVDATKKSIQENAAMLSVLPPPAIGSRVTLAPDPNDAASASPLQLHYMTSVIDAIAKQSRELYGQYTFNECGS